MREQQGTIIQNAGDLGRRLRQARLSRAQRICDLSDEAGLGARFLSELERGKETSQLGKAIAALHATGLDLAVVPREAPGSDMPLSARLELDFPYDWSNPSMPPETLIYKVLERGRFDDTLKVVRHFGFDPVLDVLPRLNDICRQRASKLLSNILAGALGAIGDSGAVTP